MTIGKRRVGLAIQSVAMMAVMLLAAPACSALGNCSDKPPGEHYWIYFDPLTNAATGEAIQNANLRKQFRSTLSSHFDDLNAELEQQDARLIELVECNGTRSPGDAGDFNATEIQLLDDHRVILEIWGSLNPSDGTGSLGYVLVPRGRRETPTAFVHQQSLMTAGGARRKPVFKQNPELLAYAHIVLGIRSFNNQDYGEAGSHLCKGKILLEQVVDRLKNSPQNSERIFVARQRRLIDEVHDLAIEAVSHASPNSALRAAMPADAADFQCPASGGN